MGVDCHIWLPGNAHSSDVANVIGKLLGQASSRMPLNSSRDDSWAIQVEGVKVVGNVDIPSMATIRLDREGEVIDCFFFHFEASSHTKHEGVAWGRSMNPRSNALSIAMAQKLVDFFGGYLDYQDCDDDEFDYKVMPRSDQDNTPQDGNAWAAMQLRVEAVEKLAFEDIEACIPLAAYTMDADDLKEILQRFPRRGARALPLASSKEPKTLRDKSDAKALPGFSAVSK